MADLVALPTLFPTAIGVVMKHGTISGYSYHKCKCEECKAFAYEYKKKFYRSKEYYKDRRKNNERYRQQELERNRRRNKTPERKQSKRDYGQKRRTIMLDAFVEDVDRNIVFESVEYECQLCGIVCDKEATFPASNFPSLDHIIPLSKGGKHSYDNVQLLCLECNLRKSDKIIERSA